MIVVLLGGTCAGKTELALKFRNNGFEKVITNTTRNRRVDDSENSYHFLTKEQFFEKVNNGEMIEYAEYNGNYYGTSVDSLSENCVIVLEPNGLKAIKEKLGSSVYSIYLDVPDEIRLQRGLSRGDDEGVLRKRIEEDRELFSILNEGNCDLIIKGNNSLERLENIIKRHLVNLKT